jgi:NAD-dependent SIR2 family protein deacetylase
MNEEEKEIQKALGTFPTFKCNQCGKEFFEDEKFIFTPTGGVHLWLCPICATAQFVCDRILKRPAGAFTRESVEKFKKEDE